MKVRRPDAAALTLIEIMAALAITAILLAAVFGVLATTLRGTIGMRDVLHTARLEAGLGRLVGDDVLLAVAVKDGDQLPLTGAPAPMGQQGVALAVLSTRALYATNRGRLVRVEYVLRPSLQRAGAWQLLRREIPFAMGRTADGNDVREEVLLDGLATWRALFFDGDQWSDTWRQDGLPMAVGVDFSFAKDPATVLRIARTAPAVTRDADPLPPAAKPPVTGPSGSGANSVSPPGKAP